MSMIDWARNEVSLACDHMTAEEREHDYAGVCFQTALKAFELICKESLTGFQVPQVQTILNRLISRKPLTPIEDVPESWSDEQLSSNDKIFQCKRMSGLFKHIEDDGSVRFSDVDRVICTDQVSDTQWHNGLADRLIEEMFPIKFPYYPADKPYKVRMNEYLTDRKNGDFDTVMYIDVTSPDGTVTPINRYFGETEEGWKELTSDEFTARYAQHLERIRKEKEEKNEREANKD